MSAVLAWAIEASIASSLLMAAVLLMRAPVRRVFGPQVAYALWALPLLRIVLPPMPAGWSTAAMPVSRVGETIAVLVVAPPISTAAALPAASALPMAAATLLLIWVLGAVAFLLWHIERHRRFCRIIVDDGELIARVGSVMVVASTSASGPLAFGVVRRFVAFPCDFADNFDEQERAFALAHELAHHRRGDLLANWAALAVLAFHWINPLAWTAFRAFRADQELATDAHVLAGRNADERHAYARAIVKAAHGGAVSAACHFRSVFNLKRRLKMLTGSRTSPRRLAAGSAAVSLLVAGGLGFTASGGRAAERLRASVTPASTADLTAPTAQASAVGARQLRTVVVKRDGTGAPAVVVRGSTLPTGKQLADGLPLPKGFTPAEACRDQRGGTPVTYVIRGSDGDSDYTVTCTGEARQVGSGAASVERSAYRQALSALRSERHLIATQIQPPLSDKIRGEALATVDLSIADLERDLAEAD